MVRLVCVVEIAAAVTEVEAQDVLDAFREATQASSEYGVSIYRATEQDADTALYAVIGEGAF